MKRQNLINRLLKEGFKPNTLINLSDKNLILLHNKVVNEDVMVSKKDPKFNEKVTTAKKENKTIETYESKSKKSTPAKKKTTSKKSEPIKKKIETKESAKSNFMLKNNKKSAMKISEGLTLNKEVKNWLEKLVESKMNNNSVATKSEIMSLIRKKINEEKMKSDFPSFMSFDSIKSNEPTIKPAPVKPDTKPGTRPQRINPWKPGPGINPKPKAGEPATKPAPVKPDTKPGTRPQRINPWKPGPGINPKPKARN